jgi:putative sterol carrier protein
MMKDALHTGRGVEMDEEVKNEVGTLIQKFNDKAATDEKMQKELEGLERKIQLDFGEDGVAHFILKDKKCGDIAEGSVEGAEIILTTDKVTFIGLVNGNVSPWKAYATKKIKVKASLQDMLTLKKFF